VIYDDVWVWIMMYDDAYWCMMTCNDG